MCHNKESFTKQGVKQVLLPGFNRYLISNVFPSGSPGNNVFGKHGGFNSFVCLFLNPVLDIFLLHSVLGLIRQFLSTITNFLIQINKS